VCKFSNGECPSSASQPCSARIHCDTGTAWLASTENGRWTLLTEEYCACFAMRHRHCMAGWHWDTGTAWLTGTGTSVSPLLNLHTQPLAPCPTLLIQQYQQGIVSFPARPGACIRGAHDPTGATLKGLKVPLDRAWPRNCLLPSPTNTWTWHPRDRSETRHKKSRSK